MDTMDVFSGAAGEQRTEAPLSTGDTMLSLEKDLAHMHQILSEGIGAYWEGEACDRHRSLEETLFRRAEEALQEIRSLL